MLNDEWRVGELVNFYWRQTIVGLLHHAAEDVPALERRATVTADEVDRTMASEWLEEAFAVFQEAALGTRDPIYVTGAYYAMQALEDAERWEEQVRGPARSTQKVHREVESTREVDREVDQGMLELFERIRAGASLEEALDLFPLVGEESNPYD